MSQRVRYGEIGHTLMFHGQYLQDWLLYDTDYDWRMDTKICGPSRAVADIGSHWFDTAQFVTGKKIKSVFASLMTMHPVRKRYNKTGGSFSATIIQPAEELVEEVPIATEDAAFIMVRLEDGTPGSLIVSQVSAGKKNDLRLNISGSACSIEWKQENPDKLWLGHRSKPNEILYSCPQALTGDAKRYATLPNGHPVAWHDALRNGINEFYISIRANTYKDENQNYATFRNGHQIIQLVEACLESNRRNSWIDVQEG